MEIASNYTQRTVQFLIYFPLQNKKRSEGLDLFFPNWWIINYLFYKRGCQIRATWFVLLPILSFAPNKTVSRNWSKLGMKTSNSRMPALTFNGILQ